MIQPAMRLGAAEGGHEQRDRDERPDPDHVDHVQRRRVDEAEAAMKMRLRRGHRQHHV